MALTANAYFLCVTVNRNFKNLVNRFEKLKINFPCSKRQSLGRFYHKSEISRVTPD